MLIGNSHLRGIKPDKLSRDFNAKAATAFTIKDAHEVVKCLKSKPQAVVFQLTTNDVDKLSTQATVQEYKQLIQDTQAKLSSTKIIISQAPNNPAHPKSTRITGVNATLADMYQDSPITCIDNSQISAFSNDGIHLTRFGTSARARSMKRAVYEALGLPFPARQQQPQNHSRQQFWMNSNRRYHQ